MQTDRMDPGAADPVLRRMARAGRRSHEARAMPPNKALRLALARAGDEALDLAMAVQGVRSEELDQAALIEGIGEGQLYLLLTGPEGRGAASGALVLDMASLSAVIEAQVLGRVLSRTPPDRRPTATDAAMIAPLGDALLTHLSANLREDPDGWWADGFRCGPMIEDRRGLGLVLDTGVFRSFRMSVEFDGGAREGLIHLILPVLDAAQQAPRAEVARPAPAVTYAREMAHVPVELTAVLDRLRLPLTEAVGLGVGAVLPLSPGAAQQVRLSGPDRRDVGAGTLGQRDGRLAVRLGPGQRAAVPAGEATAAVPRDGDQPKGAPSSKAGTARSAKVAALAAQPVGTEAPPRLSSPAMAEALPDLPPPTLED